VSEQFLNGTSAVSTNRLFTLEYAGKYVTEDKLKTDTLQKLNTAQKKQTTQNTAEQNYPGLVAIRQLARKRGGLILQSSRAHTGLELG